MKTPRRPRSTSRKKAGDCLLIEATSDAAFCRRAVEKTVREFGKLDVLVNNAAFQEHAESIEDLTDDQFDLTMRTNVYGYFHMAKAAVPHLQRRRRDHQHRLGDRPFRRARAARLFGDEGRDPRIHEIARGEPVCRKASASTRSRRARCGRR